MRHKYSLYRLLVDGLLTFKYKTILRGSYVRQNRHSLQIEKENLFPNHLIRRKREGLSG